MSLEDIVIIRIEDRNRTRVGCLVCGGQTDVTANESMFGVTVAEIMNEAQKHEKDHR
jgi:hypothetical protein